MGQNYLIVGAILVALGIALFLFHRRLRAQRAGWPSCPGRIDDARVTKETVSTGKGGRRSFDRLTLKYSYAVGGTTHQGTGTSDVTSKHASLMSKYAVGGPVDVAYHPAKPGLSEIRDRDVTAAGLITIVLTLGVSALAIGLIIGVVGAYAVFHDGR